MQKSPFKKAVELIEQHPELAHFSGPKSEELIKKFEEKLGVQFPESYRNFLRRFGGGGFCSQEFYGIYQNEADGFSETFLRRRLSNWPIHFIAVYGVGEGTEFVIDTLKRDWRGENPIFAVPIQYEKEDQLELVAHSFGEFFYDTVWEAIEDDKDPPDQ